MSKLLPVKYFTYTLLLVPSLVLGHITGHINRPDESIITYYLNSPHKTDFSLVVFVQGSGDESAKRFMEPESSFEDAWKGLNAAVLVVEKPGLTQKNNGNTKEYLALNTVTQRIKDYQAVIPALKEKLIGWNGKIVWIGVSSGGPVASFASPLFSETAATIIICGGCGITMQEELRLMLPLWIKDASNERKFLYRVAKKVYLNWTLYRFDACIREIKNNPESEKIWLGNTYKWWNSILFKNPCISLEKLETPILVLQGSRDTMCPVQSAEKLVERFKQLGKTNLTYKCYEGLDHSFSDENGKQYWDDVFNEVNTWLEEFIPPCPVLRHTQDKLRPLV